MSELPSPQDPNWYKAKNKVGREGIIPANYVQKREGVKAGTKLSLMPCVPLRNVLFQAGKEGGHGGPVPPEERQESREARGKSWDVLRASCHEEQGVGAGPRGWKGLGLKREGWPQGEGLPKVEHGSCSGAAGGTRLCSLGPL